MINPRIAQLSLYVSYGFCCNMSTQATWMDESSSVEVLGMAQLQFCTKINIKTALERNFTRCKFKYIWILFTFQIHYLSIVSSLKLKSKGLDNYLIILYNNDNNRESMLEGIFAWIPFWNVKQHWKKNKSRRYS